MMPNDEISINNNQEAQIKHSGLFASKRLLQRWLDTGLDLLFPPRCAGCNQVDTYWCVACQDALNTLPLLPTSASPAEPPLTGRAATAPHTGRIREAVQALKYDNNQAIAAHLGRRLSEQWQQLNWTIDIIVPVPLHTIRYENRGYNQAQLLAEYFSYHTSIPYSINALQRLRYTPSQVGLDAQQRRENMIDAFLATPYIITDKNILLIDDVYTTGATINSCADALLKSGAANCYALTVTAAIGPLIHYYA